MPSVTPAAEPTPRAAAREHERLGRHLHTTLASVWLYLRADGAEAGRAGSSDLLEGKLEYMRRILDLDGDYPMRKVYRDMYRDVDMASIRSNHSRWVKLASDLDTFARETTSAGQGGPRSSAAESAKTRESVPPGVRVVRGGPRESGSRGLAGEALSPSARARRAYLQWSEWVEQFAGLLGVALPPDSRSSGSTIDFAEWMERPMWTSSFSDEYCQGVGEAFGENSQACMHSRQILLFWLGICIREGSREDFEAFVLTAYRSVAVETEPGALSDVVRVSVRTFADDAEAWLGATRPAAYYALDRCVDAPLLGFLAEPALWPTRRSPADVRSAVLPDCASPEALALLGTALVYAIDAGNEELTEDLLGRFQIESGRQSVVQLARSKQEKVKSLNSIRHLTLMASCLVKKDERKQECKNMDRVPITPMLAATKRGERAKTWAAKVIRRLYELGADFRSCATQTAGMQEMVLQDPMYQLIKFQIRAVTQAEISAQRSVVNSSSSDQIVAEKLVAENLSTWRPILDVALDPDNKRIGKGQVFFAAAALANSARVTALPVIVYLIEAARIDLNRPVPSPDTSNAEGPRTQKMTDFYRSNYAGLVALLKRGSRISAKDAVDRDRSLESISNDSQNTHLSRVNLGLKTNVQWAEALVAKLEFGSEAAKCLTAELAGFCSDGSTSKLAFELQPKRLRVTEAYMLESLTRLSDEAVLRVGYDVPHVWKHLAPYEEAIMKVISVHELVQSGFSKEKAEAALDQANGSVAEAKQLLSSEDPGYLLFSKEMRPQQKAMLEAELADGQTLQPKDVVTALASWWKSLAEEEKAEWRADAAERRAAEGDSAKGQPSEAAAQSGDKKEKRRKEKGAKEEEKAAAQYDESEREWREALEAEARQRAEEEAQRVAEKRQRTLGKFQEAVELIRESLRLSFARFFGNLTERPVYGSPVPTGAAAVDLVYRALVCRFAGDPDSCFDLSEDVLVPLFQAVLKAHNEYGWAVNSCAPGSISFVVAVLEGRLEAPADAPAKATDDLGLKERSMRQDASGLSLYREKLEKASRDLAMNLEAIRDEAVQCCLAVRGERFCSETLPRRSQEVPLPIGGLVQNVQNGSITSAASRGPLDKAFQREEAQREALKKILDVIVVEPDAFAYAENELRGFFFSQLVVKYDALLAQKFYGDMDRRRRARSHRPSDILEYVEPEYISPEMFTVLDHLVGVADVFARSFLVVVEEIPRVFNRI